MASCQGRRVIVPSKGSTGRPWRSTIQPRAGAPSCSMVTGPSSGSVRNTRTTRPPGTRKHRRDLGAFDRERTPRRRARAGRRADAGALDRDGERVGGAVAIGGAPVAAVGHDRVRHALAALHLRALDRIRRARGVGTQARFAARQVPDRAQQREGERATVVDDLVLEQAVVHEREPDGAVGRVDEATGRERRQPELLRTSFGLEPAVHDGERALRVRAGHARREREVGAEAMVAAAVVELVGDA